MHGLVRVHVLDIELEHPAQRRRPVRALVLQRGDRVGLPGRAVAPGEAALLDDPQQPGDLGLLDFPLAQAVRGQRQETAHDQLGHGALPHPGPVDPGVDAGDGVLAV